MDQPIHERLKHVSACHTATCYNERHVLSSTLQGAQQGGNLGRGEVCAFRCAEGHMVTEPAIQPQEAALHQVIEQVQDLLR
jgi:hypothetical protein